MTCSEVYDMWCDDTKTEQFIRIKWVDEIPEELRAIEKLPSPNEKEIAEINEAFPSYIFYRRSGKHISAFCTYCNTAFTAADLPEPELPGMKEDTVRHNSFIACPCCGEFGLCKSAGHSQKNLTAHANVTLFRTLGDKLWALNFKAHKSYNGDPVGIHYFDSNYRNDRFERMPDIFMELATAYVYEQGMAVRYRVRQVFSHLTRTWVSHLEEAKDPIKPGLKDTVQYMYNIAEYPRVLLGLEAVRASPITRYSAFDKAWDYDICCYLSAYVKYPILEFISKAGFDRLRDDLLTRGRKNHRLCDWSARTPKGFFRERLDNAEIREAARKDVGPGCLGAYINAKKEGQRRSFEECEKLCQANGTVPYFKKYPLTFDELDRLCKYLRAHGFSDQVRDIGYYADYLDIARRLNYSMTAKGTLYPRSLTKAHDDAVENLEIIRREERIKAIEAEIKDCEKRYKALCREYSSFSFPGVKLVVPAGPKDIIDEGAALCHCVGSYAHRHMKGETTILFVRREEEPDKPWFTVEIRNGILMQCHGYRNEMAGNPKPPIIKDFEQALYLWLEARALRKTG
jgi:hypothetical protein